MQREYNLSDLVDLVVTNNLEAIKKILERHPPLFMRFGESLDQVNFAVKAAILSGNVEAAKIFFDADISVNGCAYQFSDKKGRTLISFLECAVLSGSLEMVKLLVEREVTIKPNNANQFPERALSIAIKRGYTMIVDLFFEHGANNDPLYEIYYLPAVGWL
jgi:ankyrin repeat protein